MAEPEIWTLQRLLNWSEEYFKSKGIESPRLDAELLIAHAFNLKRIEVYTQFDRPLDATELANYKTLLIRRAEREPLAYIIGSKEFYGQKFRVNKHVLIPRPETEQLVELASKWALQKNIPEPKLLEVGVGSGCVLISVLKPLNQASATAIDLSAEAIACAQENAAYHGVLSQISWINQDFTLLANDHFKPNRFDLILANLPYISNDDYTGLAPEIKNYEPRSALVAAENGLGYIYELIDRLFSWLAPYGIALLEIGAGQAPAISKHLERYPKFAHEFHQDLSGHQRILAISLKN